MSDAAEHTPGPHGPSSGDVSGHGRHRGPKEAGDTSPSASPGHGRHRRPSEQQLLDRPEN
ncbi:hypothetical protein [Streptomyces sp. NPDC054784]